MALWTDPSRSFLIHQVERRPILWDKNFTADQNYRNAKTQALQEITNEINATFPMGVKFSCEDLRSQWKNLKDTFVRKLRWVTEGKYSGDPLKEPAWKFYRMLSFLDEKEMKRLGLLDSHNAMSQEDNTSYDVINSHPEINRNDYSMHMKNDTSIHYEHSNQSASSSEEQMLQMFNQTYEKPQVHSVSPPSPSLPMPVSSAPCSTETICAKPPYSPVMNQSSGSSHQIDDDEDEPRRKRACDGSSVCTINSLDSNTVYNTHEFQPYPRRQQPMSNGNGIGHHMQGQDEFDLFGACVAAQLRRLCEEHSRGAALRLQKKLSDTIYENQIELLR